MSVKFHPEPRRILVRGVNWLGDAVMTTPALLRLREKFPGAHIAILTPEKISGLWKNHPAIDEVISFTAEENIFAVARKLREGCRVGVPKIEIRDGGTPSLPGKFDLALVLPNSPRSALEVFLAGTPQRIGYARPWRNFFLTQALPPRTGAVKMHKRTADEIRRLVSDNSQAQCSKLPPAAHQVHEYLHLVAALGANPEPLAPQLAVTAEEIAAAKEKFGLDKASRLIFGLNPGAEYGPAKRWPAEKFIAAAKEIQKQTNCCWLIFGGKGDVALAENIGSALRTPHSALTNVCGRTSLRELMALLKGCRVLLTNDTGPMHVASALGTPVVVPFGSTSPELTGPIFSPNAKILKSDAPCSPCFLRECPIDFRCMNGITVESVVGAVLQSVG
jgi:heptosyltransferase-2